MREASKCKTAIDTDSCAFSFSNLNLLPTRGEPRHYIYFIMDESLKSQFLSLYCMVLADGIIDARELEMLYKIGTEQYGLSSVEIISTVKDAGSSFILPDTLDKRIQLLYNMAQIAYSDGVIDPTERNLLKKYIAKMEFAEENIEEIADYLLTSVQNGVSLETILNQIRG